MNEEIKNECADCEIHFTDEVDEMTYYASKEEKEALAKQSRWKSPVTWSAIFGLVMTIITVTGLADKIGISDAGLKSIIIAFGSVLSAFGIINNPTNSEGL